MVLGSKRQVSAGLFVLLGACLASAAGQLLELSGDQLLDAIEASRSGEPLLVEFYAKWDGSAKTRGQVLAELADAHVVKVARVEFYKHQHVAHRLGVKAMRTICLFHNGFTYRFEGDANIEEITAFVKGGYLSAAHERTPTKPTFIDNLVGFYQTASLDPKYLTTALHSHENAKYVFGTAAILALVSLVVFEFVFGYLVETADAPTKKRKPVAAARRSEAEPDEDDDEDDSDSDSDSANDDDSQGEGRKVASDRGRDRPARHRKGSDKKQAATTKRKSD